jgi:hypothetical protein
MESIFKLGKRHILGLAGHADTPEGDVAFEFAVTTNRLAKDQSLTRRLGHLEFGTQITQQVENEENPLGSAEPVTIFGLRILRKTVSVHTR